MQHGPWIGARLGPVSRPRTRGKKQFRDEEHKAAIAEAIRKKWQDPEYRSRILDGKARHTESLRREKETLHKEKPRKEVLCPLLMTFLLSCTQ